MHRVSRDELITFPCSVQRNQRKTTWPNFPALLPVWQNKDQKADMFTNSRVIIQVRASSRGHQLVIIWAHKEEFEGSLKLNLSWLTSPCSPLTPLQYHVRVRGLQQPAAERHPDVHLAQLLSLHQPVVLQPGLARDPLRVERQPGGVPAMGGQQLQRRAAAAAAAAPGLLQHQIMQEQPGFLYFVGNVRQDRS